MFGWFYTSSGRLTAMRRALRATLRSGSPGWANQLANLRFSLDEPYKRCRRTSHRAVLDAECGARSSYLPPPSV